MRACVRPCVCMCMSACIRLYLKLFVRNSAKCVWKDCNGAAVATAILAPSRSLSLSLCLGYVYKLLFGWNRRDSAPSSSLNWHCYLHTKIHFIQQQLHTNCVVYNKLETHDGFFPMCVCIWRVHCYTVPLSHKTKILNEKSSKKYTPNTEKERYTCVSMRVYIFRNWRGFE